MRSEAGAGVDLVEEPHPLLGQGERADRLLFRVEPHLVGWVECFDPDLAAGLSWADAFMRSPEALALFLEACGQAVLERAGEILEARARQSV